MRACWLKNWRVLVSPDRWPKSPITGISGRKGQRPRKIGESADKSENIPVRWDTRNLANGKYEIHGLMLFAVKTVGSEKVIARQRLVEITAKN